MPNPYEPAPKNFDSNLTADIGWLLTEFDPFDVHPDYGWSYGGDNPRSAPKSKDAWKIIEPRKSPAIGDLPHLVKTLIESTWKRSIPLDDPTKLESYQKNPMTLSFANRDSRNVVMGARGNTVVPPRQTFAPEVRPTKSNIPTTMGNKDKIASDWDLFNTIKRINAVTFRGDGRTPREVIIRSQGFHPPNTRTDDYYLNEVYKAFAWYMLQRYQRVVDINDFKTALDSTSRNLADKNLIVDYFMWRTLCDREANHLGRMVENECLKGYISTARSIDTAVQFATDCAKREGWIYLVVVNGGFIVPWGEKQKWGSGEAEIAQWGPIPDERVVGFMHTNKYLPNSQIFIRRSFRQSEPKAFKAAFDVMSGKTPIS